MYSPEMQDPFAAALLRHAEMIASRSHIMATHDAKAFEELGRELDAGSPEVKVAFDVNDFFNENCEDYNGNDSLTGFDPDTGTMTKLSSKFIHRAGKYTGIGYNIRTEDEDVSLILVVSASNETKYKVTRNRSDEAVPLAEFIGLFERVCSSFSFTRSAPELSLNDPADVEQSFQLMNVQRQLDDIFAEVDVPLLDESTHEFSGIDSNGDEYYLAHSEELLDLNPRHHIGIRSPQVYIIATKIGTPEQALVKLESYKDRAGYTRFDIQYSNAEKPDNEMTTPEKLALLQKTLEHIKTNVTFIH